MLTIRYELAIPDFEVRDPGPFVQHLPGPPPWTATLWPAATGFELVIDIETDDAPAAAYAADAYVRRVAEHFTFWICDYDISQPAVTTRRIGSPSFQSSDPNTDPNTLHVLSGELVVGQTLAVRVMNRIRGAEVADALAVFALKEAAPSPAFAYDLEVARQMYLAGLRVDNLVARFLIEYAAMACGRG